MQVDVDSLWDGMHRNVVARTYKVGGLYWKFKTVTNVGDNACYKCGVIETPRCHLHSLHLPGRPKPRSIIRTVLVMCEACTLARVPGLIKSE